MTRASRRRVDLPGSDAVRSNVRRLRKSRDLTAKQLAIRTELLGMPMSRGTIAAFESGIQASVSVDQLLVLAAALNVPTEALLAQTSA